MASAQNGLASPAMTQVVFTLTQDKSPVKNARSRRRLRINFDEAHERGCNLYGTNWCPDTLHASYWGHMPDGPQVNGVAAAPPVPESRAAVRDNTRRLIMNSGDEPILSVRTRGNIATSCGSAGKYGPLDDLKALAECYRHVAMADDIVPIMSQDEGQKHKYYCSFNETTGCDKSVP